MDRNNGKIWFTIDGVFTFCHQTDLIKSGQWYPTFTLRDIDDSVTIMDAEEKFEMEDEQPEK